MASGSPKLVVLIDGEPMPEDDARAFWSRFSAFMDANRGDLKGFAAQEGYASVHPETGPTGAVLAVSRSAPQRAYVTAPHRANVIQTRSSGPSKIHKTPQKPGK